MIIPLRWQLLELQDAYIAAIDDDRLELFYQPIEPAVRGERRGYYRVARVGQLALAVVR